MDFPGAGEYVFIDFDNMPSTFNFIEIYTDDAIDVEVGECVCVWARSFIASQHMPV